MRMQHIVLMAIFVEHPYPLSIRYPGTVSSIIAGQMLMKIPALMPKMNLPTKIVSKSRLTNESKDPTKHTIQKVITTLRFPKRNSFPANKLPSAIPKIQVNEISVILCSISSLVHYSYAFKLEKFWPEAARTPPNCDVLSEQLRVTSRRCFWLTSGFSGATDSCFSISKGESYDCLRIESQDVILCNPRSVYMD